MKTILVPTDFSKNATNALNYAVALAKKENAKIILLHVYYILYISTEVPMDFYSAQVAAAEQAASKKLKSLCKKVQNIQKIKCEIINREGLTVDTILDTIKKKKPDMVIMGTKGASGIKEVFMGSNTASVIKKAKCPIIAVPERASFKGIKNITYASDYHSSDIVALKKIVELAKMFKSNITILHIFSGEFAHDLEEDHLKKFKQKVKSKIAYTKIKYHLTYGRQSLITTLANYVKSESPDLLVMSTFSGNLFDKLFGTSDTKKMAFHTKIPLLAFHYKQESVVFIS